MILFSIVAAPIYILTNSVQGFLFPILFICYLLLMLALLTGVISHCGFDLHFWDCDVQRLFYVYVGHVIIFFGKMFIQILYLFFFFFNFSTVLFFVAGLYKLFIYFGHIFSSIQKVSFYLWWWFPVLCGSFLVRYSPICLLLFLFSLLWSQSHQNIAKTAVNEVMNSFF